MIKGAIISDCKYYRYSLWRLWDQSKRTITFIGLNPSTADAQEDDHTILKLIEYTKKWCFGGFYVVNLFAYRATDSKKIKQIIDPVGENNDDYIASAMEQSELVIAMWSNHGNYNGRADEVYEAIKHMNMIHCFKVNRTGEPAHPLMLSYDTQPVVYNRAPLVEKVPALTKR